MNKLANFQSYLKNNLCTLKKVRFKHINYEEIFQKSNWSLFLSKLNNL